MSTLLNDALQAVTTKLGDQDLPGTVKFTLNGEGSIVIDGAGAHISDEETDVTLSADPEVFKDILEGNLGATGAFMTGRLSIDGNMGIAMQLASYF